MAGRPAKPIELHLLNGNKRHLTKAEIEQRKKSEVKLGEHKLVCPSYVRQDKNAYKKWKEIVKLYKDIDYVFSVSGVIAVDKALNAKMSALVQMEDRLFLNPLAKVRNIPKKEVKEEDPLAGKGFGNV